MNENLYQPPESRLKPKEPEPGSPLKAILVSVAIDIFGTVAMSLILGFAVAIYWKVTGASWDGVMERGEEWSLTTPMQLIAIVLGSLVSLFAGYTCARIAKRNVYYYATIAGLLVTFIAYLLGMQAVSQAENIFLSVLSLAVFVYGAHLYKKRADI